MRHNRDVGRILKILIEVVSWLFIFLWVYAAVSKLLDFSNFQAQLGQSPMLNRFAGIIAWMIPVIEIIVAIFLGSLRWRLGGMYASYGLMIMFTAYIIVILNYSESVPCSCGGILEKMSWNQHFIFNLTMVVLALCSILLFPKKMTTAKRKNIL